MGKVHLNVSVSRIHIDTSNILNAKSLDRYMMTCLTEACILLRDDIKKYVKIKHDITHPMYGDLRKSIRYRTWATKTLGRRASVYSNRADFDTYHTNSGGRTIHIEPHAEYVIGGTNAYKFENERQVFYSQRYKGFYTIFKRKRKGIEGDDFMSKISEKDDKKINDIFDSHLEDILSGK